MLAGLVKAFLTLVVLAIAFQLLNTYWNVVIMGTYMSSVSAALWFLGVIVWPLAVVVIALVVIYLIFNPAKLGL